VTPEQARAFVAQVARAYPVANHGLAPSSLGWVAWVGVITGSGETPRTAAFRLVGSLANARGASAPLLSEVDRARAERICDALSEAYDALGGDWGTA
jgi:hypothetical protein